MAELAGVLLAVPAVIELLITTGNRIVSEYQAFKRIPEVVRRYEQLGHLILNVLVMQVEIATSLINRSVLPSERKRELNGCWQNLRDAIVEADKATQKVMKSHQSKFRIISPLHYLSDLKGRFDTVDLHQMTFGRLCDTLNLYRQLPSPLLLLPEKFTIIGERPEDSAQKRLELSDIILARAAIIRENGQRADIDVIVDNNSRITEENISTIASKLDLVASSPGIPRCLGYRMNPFGDGYECIFELPPSTFKASLSQYLKHEGFPPLENRIWICKQLASVVLAVHGINHVHKCIRPGNILIVGEHDPANVNSQQVLLFDWTTMRDVDVVSRRIGEVDWKHSIYQHPDRQGLQARQYHFIHDMYSLGVCMLEVLLVQPLIVTRDNESEYNHEFFNLAVEQHTLAQGYVNEVEFRHDLRHGRHATLIRDVLCTLARNRIPAVAGTRLKDIVLRCLGFPEGSQPISAEDPDNQTSEGVEYIKNIMMELESISV